MHGIAAHETYLEETRLKKEADAKRLAKQLARRRARSAAVKRVCCRLTALFVKQSAWKKACCWYFPFLPWWTRRCLLYSVALYKRLQATFCTNPIWRRSELAKPIRGLGEFGTFGGILGWITEFFCIYFRVHGVFIHHHFSLIGLFLPRIIWEGGGIGSSKIKSFPYLYIWTGVYPWWFR